MRRAARVRHARRRGHRFGARQGAARKRMLQRGRGQPAADVVGLRGPPVRGCGARRTGGVRLERGVARAAEARVALDVRARRRRRRLRREHARRALRLDARRERRERRVVLVAVRKAAVAHELLAEAHELLGAPPQEARVVHRDVRARAAQLGARLEEVGVPALEDVHVGEVAPRVVARERAVCGAERERHRRAALPAELAVEDEQELARVARRVRHAALRAHGHRSLRVQPGPGREEVLLHLLDGVEVQRAGDVPALVLVRKAAVHHLEAADLLVVLPVEHVAHRVGRDAHQPVALHREARERLAVHLKRAKPGDARRDVRRGRRVVFLVRTPKAHRRLAPLRPTAHRTALALRRTHRRAAVQRRHRAAQHQRIVRLVRLRLGRRRGAHLGRGRGRDAHARRRHGRTDLGVGKHPGRVRQRTRIAAQPRRGAR